MWTLLYWLGPLITIPLLAITLVLSVRAIERATTRPKLRGAAVCGRCGYQVGGLSQLTCPECGSDLRAAGIRTRAWETKRRGNLFWALMGFGFIVYLIGAGAGVVLREVRAGALSAPARTSGTYAMRTLLTPSSPAISSIQADSTMSWGGASQATRLEVVLFLTEGEDLIITADSTFGTFDVETTSGEMLARGVTFTPGALLEVLGDHGVDLDEPATASDLADLARVVDLALVTQWVDLTRLRFSSLTIAGQNVLSTSMTSGSTPPWSMWDPLLIWTVAIVGGLILWLIGGALMFDRRRTLLREAGWGVEGARASGAEHRAE